MELAQYESDFVEFIENISITASQESRIESALVNISEIMLAEFEDAEIYAQGSYALDVLVKPLTQHESSGGAGKFDIDIAVDRESWTEASRALTTIESVLQKHGVYGSMEIDTSKDSCVRIIYAEDGSTGVGFHVDIVPIKKDAGGRKIAKRTSNSWEPSDSKQFIDWFLGQAEETPSLRALILALKRLRDLAELTDDLKSIVTIVLIVAHYNSQGDLLSDFASVTESISDFFQDSAGNPEILNPVNVEENLADKLTNIAAISDFFLSLKTDFDEMIVENDPQKLVEIFGNAFPGENLDKRIAANVSQRDPGEQFLSDLGIEENLRYSLTLNARVVQDGWRPFFLRGAANPLRKQRHLEFFIENSNAPTPFSVKWKVKNAGQEATSASDLRGEIIDDAGGHKKREYKIPWFPLCGMLFDKR